MQFVVEIGHEGDSFPGYQDPKNIDPPYFFELITINFLINHLANHLSRNKKILYKNRK